MKKIGRNDPCPCGSGKKHKRCCLSKMSSTALPTTARRSSDSSIDYRLACFETDLDQLSNSVVDFINMNKLDKAEKACMRILEEFPDCVDGIMRLVAVHTAKKNFALAADYALQTVAFMKERGNDFSPEWIEDFENQERTLKQRAA